MQLCNLLLLRQQEQLHACAVVCSMHRMPTAVVTRVGTSGVPCLVFGPLLLLLQLLFALAVRQVGLGCLVWAGAHAHNTRQSFVLAPFVCVAASVA
jgi:hypothetical protein